MVSGDAERSPLPGDGRRGGSTHVAHTPQSATHSTRVDQVRVPSEHTARAQTYDGDRRRFIARGFAVTWYLEMLFLNTNNVIIKFPFE